MYIEHLKQKSCWYGALWICFLPSGCFAINALRLWYCLLHYWYFRELLLCQTESLQLLFQCNTRDRRSTKKNLLWNSAVLFCNYLLKFDFIFWLKLLIYSLKENCVIAVVKTRIFFFYLEHCYLNLFFYDLYFDPMSYL